MQVPNMTSGFSCTHEQRVMLIDNRGLGMDYGKWINQPISINKNIYLNLWEERDKRSR